MRNQRELLPPADRALLERVMQHQDPAEVARRRRLIEAPFSDNYDVNAARNDELFALLKPYCGDEILRTDRLVRALAWNNLFEDEIAAGHAQRANVEQRADQEKPSAGKGRNSITPPAEPEMPAEPSARAEPATPPAEMEPGSSPLSESATPPESSTRPPCAAAARDFLMRVLADGERPAKTVMAKAAALGLTALMGRAVRARLGVLVARRGFGAGHGSYWRLARSKE